MLFFVLWYFNIAVRPFEGCIGSSQTLHYTLNYLLAGLIPTWALFLLHARRDIASSMVLCVLRETSGICLKSLSAG